MIKAYSIDLIKAIGSPDLPQIEWAFGQADNLPILSFAKPHEMLNFHQGFARFHSKLVELTGNARILHFHKTISLNLTRYPVMCLFMPGSVNQSLLDHLGILYLLKKAGYDQAKKFLLNHLRFALKALESKNVQDQLEMSSGVLNSTQ